jgi:ubiquinone biosynthesis protein
MTGLRSLAVAAAAARLLLLAMRERVRRLPPERSALPDRLRRELERLGPSFVKAGQALSLRQDLLPERFLAELEKLQAEAAPFPTTEARREIEASLGKPVEALFARFEDRPLAAASIAQVHAATLPDGREVIVKIRRPGIRRRIDRDMRSLVRVLRLLARLSRRLARLEPAALAEEIWTNLRRETDFHLEARAMGRFAAAFRDDSRIEVPAVIEPLATESVLVQEFKQGHLIGDARTGEEGRRLARDLVEIYLRQIFVLGYFHGDPHPGNLFFTESGAICFHDFGLVGQLDRGTRRDVAMFVQAFVHQDAAWMLDAAVALGLLAPRGSAAPFVRGLEEILADYSALPLNRWSIAELFLRVTRLGPPGSVRVPHNLLVLMRAMFLLESALRRLDPEMNVLEALSERGEAAFGGLAGKGAPFDLPRLRYELALAGQEAPGALAAAVGRARRAGFRAELPIRMPDVERLQAGVERTGNRLALAIVTLGLYVGSSLLMQHSIGPRLLDVPALALAGFLLALWYSLRLARAIGRSGHL